MDLRDRPETDEGVAYVTQLPGKYGRKMCVKGIQYDAPADAATPHDEVFAETREIQGAWFEIINAMKGDHVELFIVMPADYGGSGNPETVVGQFAETLYIPPSGKIGQIVSESTVSFPPGFLLRMVYTAVAGGETREVYAWYRMRK
jgi:hypothetical protein